MLNIGTVSIDVFRLSSPHLSRYMQFIYIYASVINSNVLLLIRISGSYHFKIYNKYLLNHYCFDLEITIIVFLLKQLLFCPLNCRYYLRLQIAGISQQIASHTLMQISHCALTELRQHDC